MTLIWQCRFNNKVKLFVLYHHISLPLFKNKLLQANDIYIDNSKIRDYYLNDCMTTTEKIRDTLENTINLAELLASRLGFQPNNNFQK